MTNWRKIKQAERDADDRFWEQYQRAKQDFEERKREMERLSNEQRKRDALKHIDDVET